MQHSLPRQAHAAEIDEAKLAAKRAVRQSRHASESHGREPAIGASNVLVHDEDEASLESICALLEGFGFCTYPAPDLAQARWLAQRQAFSAAFVAIRFDGQQLGASLELCQLLKLAGAGGAQGGALVVLFGRERQSDRIRAMMVGADATVAKPASRGDIARSLEDCGVVLPADARRF